MTTASPLRSQHRASRPTPRHDAGGGIRSWATHAASNARVRLFVACILSGLVLAVITGPAGSASAPASGFTGSLSFPRVAWFLGFGLALFALRLLWEQFGARVSEWTRARRGAASGRLASAGARIVLEVLLVGFGFAYVTWISPTDTWKGGLCIQIGAALLAAEVVSGLWRRSSLRSARLSMDGFIALYGLLAWMSGPLSRYLNRIGAVPHNQALGKFLMFLALGLAVIELVLYLVSLVHNRVRPRRARMVAAIGGVVLIVYGWLTWTAWSQWRASQPTTVAHWLSSQHVLVHSDTGGLAAMAAGALLVLAALAWTVVDLVGNSATGYRPQHVERFGVRRISTQSFGRPALIIAVSLLALEWPLHMDPASQSNIDTQIMPFVLLALGLNVVIGFAGLLDLGYVAFYAIGAYTAAYFTGALGAQPPFILDTFWVIPFAVITAMIAGVLLGTPTLRLRGDYLAIVTLGFGAIIEIFANNLSFTGGASGAPGSVPSFAFRLITPFLKASQDWSAVTYIPFYYLILGVVVLSMLAFSHLEHSKVGRSWTAIREDEVAADSLGVNALKYKVMAFAIGASTGGLAGVFLASQNGTLFPTAFTIQVSITVVVCVVFGGMGSIPGAVVGAIVVQGLPNYLQQHSISWYQPTDFFLYLGALLIIMMIFRPQGIIPSRRRRREIQLVELGGSATAIIDHGATVIPRHAEMLDERGPIGPETQ